MNTTTEWITIDGEGWELIHTGPAPRDIDVRTAISEARLNARAGLGCEATVTFRTCTRDTEVVQVITVSALSGDKKWCYDMVTR